MRKKRCVIITLIIIVFMKLKYITIPALFLLAGAGCDQSAPVALNQQAPEPAVQQAPVPSASLELFKSVAYGFVIKTDKAECLNILKVVQDSKDATVFHVTTAQKDKIWSGDWYSYVVEDKKEYDADVKKNGDTPGGPGMSVADLKNGNVLVVTQPQDFPGAAKGCESNTTAEAL